MSGISNEERDMFHKELGIPIRFPKKRIPFKLIFSSLQIWITWLTWALFYSFRTFWFGLTHTFDILVRRMNLFVGNHFAHTFPYLMYTVNILLISNFFEFLVNRKWASLVGVRKFSTNISMVAPAVFLIGATYAACGPWTVSNALLHMARFGATYFATGPVAVILDVCPNYAGTVAGIGFGLANIGGTQTATVAVAVMQRFILSGFRTACWIISAPLAVLSLIYIVLLKTDELRWNKQGIIKVP